MKLGINDREMILPQSGFQRNASTYRKQSKKSALAEREIRSRICQDRGFTRSEAGSAYVHDADGDVPITLMINLEGFFGMKRTAGKRCCDLVVGMYVLRKKYGY